MPSFPREIRHSDKYADGFWEYKLVTLTEEAFNILPRNRLLSECEWRLLGVKQTKGWEHYAIHKPEPHVLLFRRQISENVPMNEI
jgi:cyclin-dependent kinase regulatory subunit CKS1